ncbi:MAG: hypothetical protein KJN98_07165, partial [Pontiella sp.]|nr:hypothetical protein [Pontiella sp.]
NNYRQLGFPKLNFVMLQADGGSGNSAEAASMMTSNAKFRNLARMVDGRFRYLKGKPMVDNLLSLSVDDALEAIENEKAEEM